MLWRPAGHAHMFRLSRQVALALLGLLYFVISLCNAATVTWIAGTQSLDYHSPVNWDSGNVPTNSDDVVIGSGASVRVNQPVNVTSLRITGGATVALAAQMVFSSGVLVRYSHMCNILRQVNRLDVHALGTRFAVFEFFLLLRTPIYLAIYPLHLHFSLWIFRLRAKPLSASPTPYCAPSPLRHPRQTPVSEQIRLPLT